MDARRHELRQSDRGKGGRARRDQLRKETAAGPKALIRAMNLLAADPRRQYASERSASGVGS